MSEWVREAAEMGAEVISLPELYSSHYFCQSEDVDNFASWQNHCTVLRLLLLVLWQKNWA